MFEFAHEMLAQPLGTNVFDAGGDGVGAVRDTLVPEAIKEHRLERRHGGQRLARSAECVANLLGAREAMMMFSLSCYC